MHISCVLCSYLCMKGLIHLESGKWYSRIENLSSSSHLRNSAATPQTKNWVAVFLSLLDLNIEPGSMVAKRLIIQSPMYQIRPELSQCAPALSTGNQGGT